jgi:hypothetical protein
MLGLFLTPDAPSAIGAMPIDPTVKSTRSKSSRRATLYSSIFYETGSQQSLHRDTPVFTTRPEYLYFGNTVYLEPAGEENWLPRGPGGRP